MSEQPDLTPYAENISRRRFFRRVSYASAAVSAMLIGDGAAMAINATRSAPETRRFDLPLGVTIRSDVDIRPLGQTIGVIMFLSGLACAHASYTLNRETDRFYP